MTKRLTKIGVNPDFQELSSFVHELPTVFETGGKVIYKGRFTIWNTRIVLNILVTNITICICFNLMLLKYTFIKISHNGFILLRLLGG